MADYQQLQNMLDDQRTGTDPFAQAQAQAKSVYDQKAQPDPMSALNQQMASLFGFANQGTPQTGNSPQLFSNTQASKMNASGAPTPTQAQQTANTLFKPVNPAQMTSFMGSKMPAMLQKLGVDDKGLAFNPLGRIQLVSRLQNKFGANYNTNADALNVLSMFDQHMAKNPNAQQELNSAVTKGQRTLAALFGGSK